MGNKKVEKYDVNNILVCTFPSVKECKKEDDLTQYMLAKCYDAEHSKNGFYYKIIDNPPYIVKAICEWCGKEFDCQRFRTEDGRKNLFCSIKCRTNFQKSKTPKNCVCKICGKPYHVKQSHIDKYGSKYCSKECHRIAKQQYMLGENNHQYGLKGDKNASWKSDEKISSYGYRLIRQLNHPFKNIDDFVFEHRLVAEKYLLNDKNSVVINGNKYLSPDYIVHHIDFDRLNNNPDNLLVMTEEEHMSLHSKFRHNNGLDEYCEKYNLDKQIITNRIKATKQRSSNR